MPLPLVPIAAAVGLGLLGLKRDRDAKKNWESNTLADAAKTQWSFATGEQAPGLREKPGFLDNTMQGVLSGALAGQALATPTAAAPIPMSDAAESPWMKLFELTQKTKQPGYYGVLK